MLTSNGLMWLSGVSMCRMCLSAMRLPPCGSMTASFGRVGGRPVVISAPVLSPWHTRMSTAGSLAHAGCAASTSRRAALAPTARRRSRSAPRSSVRCPSAPCALEPCERRRDARAGEAMPALGRREIIADGRLQFLERRRRSRPGRASANAGRSLHHQQPAEMRGLASAGTGGKLREGVALRRSRAGLAGCGSRTTQDAPALGKGQAADDRRRTGRVAAAAVDDESAVLEQADADAGAQPRGRAGPHRRADRAAGRAGGAARPPPRARAACLSQGRHGREPASSSAQHRNRRRGRAKPLHQRRHSGARARLRPAHARLRRLTRPRCWCAGPLIGEADAAEAPSEAAVEVEESEMQPRRNRNRDVCRGRSWAASTRVSPYWSCDGFVETQSRTTLRHLDQIGNRSKNGNAP